MAMTANETFDERMRATHAAALERLSPKTQAQLVQRRRRALAAQDASHARPALRWAVATLAVCVIAIGVFRPLRGPSPSTSPLASTAAPTAPAETIDDNPDFYVWLDSSDATSFASE
jgi:hypothetical protein